MDVRAQEEKSFQALKEVMNSNFKHYDIEKMKDGSFYDARMTGYCKSHSQVYLIEIKNESRVGFDPDERFDDGGFIIPINKFFGILKNFKHGNRLLYVCFVDNNYFILNLTKLLNEKLEDVITLYGSVIKKNLKYGSETKVKTSILFLPFQDFLVKKGEISKKVEEF